LRDAATVLRVDRVEMLGLRVSGMSDELSDDALANRGPEVVMEEPSM
jgi:hypothetical protein